MKITKQVSMNPITVALSLVILVVAGFGGMSVVWMRTKISQSADRISQVELEQKKVDRRLQDIGAKIAESHTPEVLKAGIPATVRPSLQEQIIWVPDSYGDPQQLVSSTPR
ncbi:MAG: hypothetical protein HN675_05520 [Opitutae bacterium]|jgi:hypothetical protein|nr:hypothetical protein [Opitutae bacterium]MBT7852761.1 hypothetical protein [Opitutae bacterium]